MAKSKYITSIVFVPVTLAEDGWKYIAPNGEKSQLSFPTGEKAEKAALDAGVYEIVSEEKLTQVKAEQAAGAKKDADRDAIMAEPAAPAGKPKAPTAKPKAPAISSPNAVTIVKSDSFGKYTVNTFSDGTYGYMLPDGKFKNGYKSKDGAGKAGKKLAEKAAKAKDGAQAQLLEKQARELQERLQLVYSKAVEGMNTRIEASLRQFEKDRAKWEADVAAGKKDAKAYKAWLKDQALHNDQLKALKSALAQDLTAADKMAIAHVNSVPAGVYAEGMNFATYEIEHGAKANTSFTLYDKNTVMELVAKEPGLLPQASFDKAKDLAWNRRHVNSAVAQAVLQGQTTPQLAASLAGVAAMDQRAAMRSARTAMTSAHSLGKLKGYERAAGMGIDVEKQWLAALDQRTRGSHRHLDGETVKLDGEFSNGLKYPGDPDGPGSEVYNCRCTMVPVIGDVPYDEVERASKLGGMSYEEWKAEKRSAAPGGKAKSLDDRRRDLARKRETVHEALASETEPDEERELVDHNEEVMLQEAAVKQQMREAGMPADDPYSDARKADAWQKMQDSEWDKLLREKTGQIWLDATPSERSAAYTYTTDAYGKYNRPLNGITKDYKFRGPKSLSLNAEGAGAKIKALTSFLEKSSYDHDMFVTRGGSMDEIMNVFNMTMSDFAAIARGEGDEFIGRSGRMMSFVSTSPVNSMFYRTKQVKMNIYVPAGSEMVYAEPFSHYNQSKYNSKKWNGTDGTFAFSGEFETILQRGGSYTITGIRYDEERDNYYFDIELHPELGYDKFTEVGK